MLLKVPRTTRTFGDFASRLQSIFAQKEQTETEEKDYDEAEEEEEEEEREPEYTSSGPGRYTSPVRLKDEDFEYEGSGAERGLRPLWGPGSVLSLRLYRSRKKGKDGRWKLKYRLRQKSDTKVRAEDTRN